MTDLQLGICILMFSASLHGLINSSFLLANHLSQGHSVGLCLLRHALLLRQADLQIYHLQQMCISLTGLYLQVAARSASKQQYLEQL